MAPSPTELIVARIVAKLMAATTAGTPVSLDTIGDAVGDAPLSYDDIALVIDRLEAAGRVLDAPRVELKAELGRVLTAARALRQEHGRTPRIAELTHRTGLSTTVVVAALRFARTLA